MSMPDEAATSLGSGMRDVMRTGSIGLRLPLVPTRQAEGEPALFIPDKWSVEIVRVGNEALATPRPLPTHALRVGARTVQGSVLHVPRGKSVVLGRDPSPKDEREQDEDQICVKMLRRGAPPERVSSAVVSLVRIGMEEFDSVYAVNGHYSKGAQRHAPKLHAFVEDGRDVLVKHLNGPHVSTELAPGMELIFGYKLDGVDEARTYREPNERVLYVESLVDEHPAFRLDDIRVAARIGARQTCLVLARRDADATELSAPEGERPAVRLSRVQTSKAPMPALEFDIAAVASRLTRHGSYELLVGGDREQLRRMAAQRGTQPDIACLSGANLAPVQAAFRIREGGDLRVEPLCGAAVQGFVPGTTQPRAITSEEPLNDGNLVQLGAGVRMRLFNRKVEGRPPAASSRPAPSVRAPAPAGPAEPDPMDRTRLAGGTPTPLMQPKRSWLQRLFGR